MTDKGRHGRGLVALALVPLTAGLFGMGVVWAGSHDPTATAPTTPAPVPAATLDLRVEQLAAHVADAQARVATLQAVLDQRVAEAAAAQAAAAAAPAPAAAAVAPAAPAPAPAPPPPVDTVTKASG